MSDGRPLILVMDPDAYLWSVAQMVLGLDYRVERAADHAELQALARKLRPQLILFEDIHTGARDLLLEPELRDIQSLPITRAKATEGGPMRRDRFRLELRSRVDSRMRQRVSAPPDSLILSVLMSGSEFTASLSGQASFLTKIPAFPLEDFASFERKLTEPAGGGWQTVFDSIGTRLHELFFASREIQEIRARAMDSGAILKFRIAGGTELLAIPFELMTDPEQGSVLATQHPISRTITDVRSERTPVTKLLLESAAPQPLRILLIGSDPVHNSNIKVDEELFELQRDLSASFRRYRIEAKIEVRTPDNASLEAVEEELRTTEWDIVHYAGHSGPPEDPGALPFFRQRRGEGEPARMSAQALAECLRNSEVKFVYLNCCLGASILGPAIIQAGVPACLTFRWQHHGKSLLDFALKFYQELAAHRDPEIALLRTRAAVFYDPEINRELQQSRELPLWASALLLHQH